MAAAGLLFLLLLFLLLLLLLLTATLHPTPPLVVITRYQVVRSLLHHVDELDTFLALSDRVTAIQKNILMKSEERAVAEGDGGGGDDGDDAAAGDAAPKKKKKHVVQPMDGDQLQQASFVIQQFQRLVTGSQYDVRSDHDIQHLLRVCLGMLPMLQQSAMNGPFTDVEQIPLAEQCLFELHQAICHYNEEALLFQVGDGY